MSKDTKKAAKRRIRRRVGDIVAIPLTDGHYGFGRVLERALMAFYDLKSSQLLPPNEIICAPIAFKINVMKYPIADGLWPILGRAELGKELHQEPEFFKQDRITGALSIYRDSTGCERPAAIDECRGLECAAVWDPIHVVDRLEDHFAGRPNKWAELLQPRAPEKR